VGVFQAAAVQRPVPVHQARATRARRAARRGRTLRGVPCPGLSRDDSRVVAVGMGTPVRRT